MKLYKCESNVIIENQEQYFPLQVNDWDNLINRRGLYSFLQEQIQNSSPTNDMALSGLQAPIGGQEVWAAGVTYLRSRDARMEESKQSGGDTFYDKVYDAERPEIFFKATANRVVGTNDTLHIRRDSVWDVPEPELTLFISSEGTIEAYTVGNDMSSRSIEGENPLYLPQAKMYERCAALGPCLYVPEQPIDLETEIELAIIRKGKTEFEGKIPISNMKRTHTELVSYLFRECNFPKGCFLMTGTGLVPPDTFTLRPQDVVNITIAPIGTLTNTITQKIG
ncbi:fumarylacetoacetate hydrolase family protein [Flagellimonas onchidii]|uniref:fumarylacetoacetate hydrolase family protein n=1 Tax=Flagellimonas onchidii TaxID=2562684 RepID=UPI0010A661E4|nr:fumarylacetoacetate hydrolase family protein [Allomuricauda onchidii]